MTHCIFITGATGTIGGRILKECIEHTDAKFKLLVYGKDTSRATEEVTQTCQFWKIDETAQKRIEVVCGDIGSTTLGLDSTTYARLAKEITHTIHCAASIKLNLTLPEARSSILEGTKHVTALCEMAHKNGTFRRFNHFSTMEVAGNMSGIVKEEFLTHVRREYLNTYEQAKAETEEYLRELHEKDTFPITIYRPSMVVGDSKTGETSRFGSFYYMIEDLFLHPKAPIVPGHKEFIIDTIPIDVIAQMVVHAYDDETTNGNVYQLTAGTDQTLTLPQFSKELQKTVKKLTGKDLTPPRFVSPRLIWILNMIVYPFTFGNVRRRILINLIFLKFFFLRTHFDNSQTKAFLAQYSVTIPPLTTYLETLVQYYLEHHTKAPPTK